MTGKKAKKKYNNCRKKTIYFQHWLSLSLSLSLFLSYFSLPLSLSLSLSFLLSLRSLLTCAGLRTQVLPAAKHAAIFQASIIRG